MFRFIFIFYLFLFTTLSQAEWFKPVLNYSKNDYNLASQNWGIDQANNGWIYVANSKGLLEYTGIHWQRYAINSDMVRSVKCVNNRIYVGGSAEFGYFTPDGKGEQKYTCLSSALKNKWNDEVWNIMEIQGSIYFQGDHSLIIYKNDSLHIINTPVKLSCSNVINGKILCGSSHGVFRLLQNELILDPYTKSLQGKKIVSMLAGRNQDLIIVTNYEGIFHLKDSTLTLDPLSKNSFVLKNQILKATICDSLLTLGSVQEGVLVVNLETGISTNYSTQNSLNNNTALNLFYDKDKNIWLALDNGIDYINLSSPIVNYNGNKALIGTGYDSYIKQNELYLATNQGVYHNSSLIPKTQGQSWGLYHYDNTLFCANDNAIFILKKHETQAIPITGCWQLVIPNTEEKQLIALLYNGLAILNKPNKEWKLLHQIKNTESFLGLLPDHQNKVYWVMNNKNGISKLNFSKDFEQIIYLKRFNMINQVGENIHPRIINNQIVFCLKNGIYYYNSLNDSIMPFADLEYKLDGRVYYEFLDEDVYGNIWYTHNNTLKVLRKELSGEYENKSMIIGFSNELIPLYLHINMLTPTLALINTVDGFSLVNIQQLNQEKPEITPFIQQVISTHKNNTQNKVPLVDLHLAYTENSIRIEYGATDFTHEHNLTYSHRLLGKEDEWSIPSPLKSKEYTSLYEGEYSFEVKVYVDGIPATQIATFSFIVSPPWFRSIVAYILYGLIIIVFLRMLYIIVIRRQKRIIKQKKLELREQKQKHLEESRVKDQEIISLQNEKLQNELDFKNQELTASTLNVMRKNETLQNLRQRAVALSKNIDEKIDIKTLKQRTIQLIGQIDTNLEHDHDFERFMKNFNDLHKGFFTVLNVQYPSLSKHDKLLCAYLKMELSSKEIAPLLNITVRGVEISRYRLRKKLQLSREINLIDFLKSVES